MKVSEDLQRGRAAYSAQSWLSAMEALNAADDRGALEPSDVELLANACFMLGRDEEHLSILERAHQGYLAEGATLRAALCAFWIGMRLFMRGEAARGGGWLARAGRLLDDEGDCVERGYLMMPEVFRLAAAGDVDGALAAAAGAAELATRFADDDLFALATHTGGQFLIEMGRVAEGLRLLDDAMLPVMDGEVSPLPTGIVYCGAITCCRMAFDPRRAQEWTDALHEWCRRQPDMIAFTGDCHLHRSELMELHGAWDDALSELDVAAARAERAGNARIAAQTRYRRGEILRLRGDLAAAEGAYREAASGGVEPQPGLALLRLAQGDTDAALAAIRRVLDETSDAARRAELLRACVDITIGSGDAAAARAACTELEAIAEARTSDLLTAMAGHARGAVELADGDARTALPHLRPALATWHELAAPYQAARVQLLIAEACRTLGDEDSAALGLAAARDALTALGAPAAAPGERDLHGLTARELQVLELVAAGRTNKAIATDLVLSERTVDRHVGNILAKLRVPSRAAATAYAYEHRLL